MSKLTAIHKQIAALQAKAERITKHELSEAVAKVKGLMSDFGVTIEHLTQSVVRKSPTRNSTAGKSAKASKKTASVEKYADPETGKTWSGFGRAPGWIADAKNRDDYLVVAVKSAVKPAPVKKAAAKPTAKKTAALTAAVKKNVATKSPAARKAASKPAVKAKAANKKGAARKPTTKASTPAPAESLQPVA